MRKMSRFYMGMNSREYIFQSGPILTFTKSYFCLQLKNDPFRQTEKQLNIELNFAAYHFVVFIN